jgi:hypothetical protein
LAGVAVSGPPWRPHGDEPRLALREGIARVVVGSFIEAAEQPGDVDDVRAARWVGVPGSGLEVVDHVRVEDRLAECRLELERSEGEAVALAVVYSGAGAAVQIVAAALAEEPIVPCAPDQEIVPVVAVERVVTCLAIERIRDLRRISRW